MRAFLSPYFRFAALAALFLVVVYTLTSVSHSARQEKLAAAPLEILQKAAAQDPNDRDVLFHLSYRLSQSGRSGEAVQLMERLVKQEPRSTRYWSGLARCATDAGRAVEAVKAYKVVATLDPLSGLPHASLGHIYAAAGLTTDALNAFEQARKIDPKIAINSEIWARCLIQHGRLAEAWDILTVSIGRIPVQDTAYHLLTIAGSKLGRRRETEQYLRRRIELTRAYPVGAVRADLARLLLARSSDRQTLQEAEELARVAVTDPAPKAEYQALLGRVLLLRNDSKGARRALEAGLRLDPKDGSCLLLWADLLQRQGEADKAARLRSKAAAGKADGTAAMVREGVRSGPEDIPSRLRRAADLRKSGAYGAAAEECHEVLRRDATNQTATVLLDVCRNEAVQELARSKGSIRSFAL